MKEEIIIPVVAFASIFGIIYTYLTTRNKERLALIEKDKNAELFNKESKQGFSALKLGIMAMGISCGILIANLLSSSTLINEDVAYPAMIFMFGGLGLIVSHYVSKKSNNQ